MRRLDHRYRNAFKHLFGLLVICVFWVFFLFYFFGVFVQLLFLFLNYIKSYLHNQCDFSELISTTFFNTFLYFSKYSPRGFWFGTHKLKNVCSKISSKQIMCFQLCCMSTKPEFLTPGFKPPTLILSNFSATSAALQHFHSHSWRRPLDQPALL